MRFRTVQRQWFWVSHPSTHWPKIGRSYTTDAIIRQLGGILAKVGSRNGKATTKASGPTSWFTISTAGFPVASARSLSTWHKCYWVASLHISRSFTYRLRTAAHSVASPRIMSNTRFSIATRGKVGGHRSVVKSKLTSWGQTTWWR